MSDFLFQNLNTIIPSLLSIISLYISVRVSKKSRLLTENINQPEFKIISIADSMYVASNKILFALDNTGSNIYRIKNVKWENNNSINIVTYKDLLVKKNNGVETFRKEVLYININLENKQKREGKIRIDYIDINGRKRKVWSPNIILDETSIVNRKLIWYQYFTKFL